MTIYSLALHLGVTTLYYSETKKREMIFGVGEKKGKKCGGNLA